MLNEEKNQGLSENERLKRELLKNEDFVAEILELQTPEEVQKKFKESGVEIETHEIQALGSVINYMSDKGITQLTEEDLPEISGGSWFDSKEAKKAASIEIGKQAVLAIGAPIIVGVSVFAKWGFDKLTKKIDNRHQKSKEEK